MADIEWILLLHDWKRLRMYLALKIVGNNVLFSIYILELFKVFFEKYVLILLFLSSQIETIYYLHFAWLRNEDCSTVSISTVDP